MAAQSRRIDIKDLSESVRELVREVQESGEDVVVVDGATELMFSRPAAETASAKTLAEPDEDLLKRRESWERIVARRAEVTQGWNSPLSAAEVVAEQRR